MITTEIEVKMRVEDHEPVRRRLVELGAELLAEWDEINTFFDNPNHDLKNRDEGLRLRSRREVSSGSSEHILTHKDPRQPGPLKRRVETELSVDDAAACVHLLSRLGYTATLSFSKRRQRWRLGSCHIELDEIPRLGQFVEIEGDEQCIEQARAALCLEDHPLVSETYAELITRAQIASSA